MRVAFLVCHLVKTKPIFFECGSKPLKDITKECAEYLNWKYEEEQGSPLLLERLLSGVFDNEEVLVVPPGMSVAASFDDKIIRAGEP
jgi:hypothetical protein